jgi:cysteine synthase A
MIHEDFLSVIGNTPMVYLPRLTAGLPGRLAVKLESLNPLGSLKDRIAYRMIDEAERSGKLRPGGHILEASSGNTAISLAALSAARGYRLTVEMPETKSLERRVLCLLFGAEVVLSPGELGLRGALAKIRELLHDHPDAIYINQGENRQNPAAHQETAREIWRDSEGRVDAVVIGVGTGGTYRGMARFFSGVDKKVELVAVEPAESAVLSGGAPNPHGIAGIGAGVITPHIHGMPLGRIEKVSTEEAFRCAKRILREEGLSVGVSTGASVTAALRLAASEAYRDRLIVALASSHGERYLSTALAEPERQQAQSLRVSPLRPETLRELELFTNPYFTQFEERTVRHESAH